MNWINILYAVDEGFLQYIFTALISLTLLSFSVSLSIHDWYTVFRVLLLLMLKMYMLLSILEGDPGEIYDKTFHAFISTHEQGSMHLKYRLQRPQKGHHIHLWTAHTWMTDPGWTCWKGSPHWCASAWTLPHQGTFLGVGQEAHHRSLQDYVWMTDFN